MEEKTDREIVLAVQTGQHWDYNDLVKRHQIGVRAEVISLIGNSHDAEDVTQEAFLQAFQKIQSLKPPFNFGAWVRQIARNMARNLLARGPRFVHLDEDYIKDRRQDTQDLAEEDLVSRVEHAVHALSGLSPPLRETSRLSYLSEYSHQQVADRLHIPLGTVKRRLWESRAQMKKEILKMSTKGRVAVPLTVVPKISIEEIANEEMSVKCKGPGLNDSDGFGDFFVNLKGRFYTTDTLAVGLLLQAKIAAASVTSGNLFLSSLVKHLITNTNPMILWI